MNWERIWYGFWRWLWLIVTFPFRLVWWILRGIGRFLGEIIEAAFDAWN